MPIDVEEIFKLSHRLAVIETDHQHLMKQFGGMELLMKEHSAKSELAQRENKQEIQSIKDLINQVRGAYKTAVIFLGILGVFNGVVMSKIIGWL